jgi:hypothetical protein
MYQPFPFKSPPKFTQVWIVGLKTCHLATLLSLEIKIHTCKSCLSRCDIFCSVRPLASLLVQVVVQAGLVLEHLVADRAHFVGGARVTPDLEQDSKDALKKAFY